MSEIILDVETTGLSIQEDHRIVEIACIEIQDLIPTKNIFYKLINPEREVSEEALKVHGYTNERLKKEKVFKEVADEFINFIEGKKLVAHNATFDISFLNHELKKIDKKTIDTKNVVDTLEIARSKYPGTSNSLDNLCKRFGIDISKREKHSALLDCELLREVYINLLGQKEPTLIPANTSDALEDSNFNNDLTKKGSYSKIVIKPSIEELEKHKKFIKEEQKKNYF